MQKLGETLEYMGRIRGAKTSREVSEVLTRLTGRRYGLTALIAGVVPPGLNVSRKEQRERILLEVWPEPWLERYLSQDYLGNDPLVSHLRCHPDPVRWQTVFAREEPGSIGMRMLEEAAEFGLKEGIGFAFDTLEGASVMISLAGETIDVPSEDYSTISMISTFAVGRAFEIRFGKPEAVDRGPLSEREIECIRWAARGKSEWEISQILGISEHTSEKHLLRAKAKLGAINRVHAVAEAIRQGYIS